MKTSKKPENFLRTPSFPGGSKAMDQFVKTHLRYPEEALLHKIAGTVSLTLDIDFKGNVIKVIVKKGLGYGCDEEAARVAGLMKFESIRYRGMHVVFHKSLHIHFHLPGAQVLNPGITYSYKENKTDGGTRYSYNISKSE